MENTTILQLLKAKWLQWKLRRLVDKIRKVEYKFPFHKNVPNNNAWRHIIDARASLEAGWCKIMNAIDALQIKDFKKPKESPK